MTDIASFVTQDPKTGASYIDWLLDGADLVSDEGLATAVLISLFTDRLAGHFSATWSAPSRWR